ncbi:MAG: hypothetical protein ABI400_00310, partial [Lacisediminihabitans sp.]
AWWRLRDAVPLLDPVGVLEGDSMNGANVRIQWLKMRDQVSARAVASKQSQEAVLVMAAQYGALSDADREVVNELLAEQLLSAEETIRFDAIALVSRFEITSALPALHHLSDWLESQQFPGAPYEWAKANRVMGELAKTSDG